jgi:hypothetical protein
MKSRYLIIVIAVSMLFYCCKKIQNGFLSNNLFYRTNPFPAVKGRVTTSFTIESDGSTQPLSAKLLDVKDKNGQSATKLLAEYEIPIYKGEILPTDTTPEMLAAKLGTAMYKPFNVNSIGGRLEVTPASVFADTGTYNVDIEVSNISGKKVFNNMVKLFLTPAQDSQIVRKFASTSAPNQELTFVTQAQFDVTVQRIPGPNKIIIKFVDKNGVIFSPLQGQVLPRVSVPTNLRFQFKQLAPYYAEEKTDTAFVYQYPEKTPTFPLFTLNNAYTVSYRIPNTFNNLNLNINPEFAVRLFPLDVPYVNGTWIITNKINFATKL